MSKGANVFIFLLGATVGSAVAWRLSKTYYEQIAEEEIASVKEVYSNRDRSEIKEGKTAYVHGEEVKGTCTYAELTKNYTEPQASEKEERMNRPRVIRPDDFGEDDAYDICSLIYYADKVLTDTRGNIIEDVEGTVGVDSLSHFGEFEDDSVFVRNDETMTDYEILRDPSDFYSEDE